jgi:hypothetical protein
MNFWIWLIIGVSVLAIFPILGARQHKREIEKAFGGRVPLDEGEFYARYFAADGVPMFVVLGVRRILEDELGIDLSRLHPEDGFMTDLIFFFEDEEWSIIDITEGCREEFGIEITRAEAVRMTNFRLMVQMVWEKIQQKNPVASFDQ